MKIIRFKYIKIGEKFMPIWIPDKYKDSYAIKIKSRRYKPNATLINNPSISLVIGNDEIVLVDDSYDRTKFIKDEIDRLLDSLLKNYKDVTSFNRPWKG